MKAGLIFVKWYNSSFAKSMSEQRHNFTRRELRFDPQGMLACHLASSTNERKAEMLRRHLITATPGLVSAAVVRASGLYFADLPPNDYTRVEGRPLFEFGARVALAAAAAGRSLMRSASFEDVLATFAHRHIDTYASLPDVIPETFDPLHLYDARQLSRSQPDLTALTDTLHQILPLPTSRSLVLSPGQQRFYTIDGFKTTAYDLITIEDGLRDLHKFDQFSSIQDLFPDTGESH